MNSYFAWFVKRFDTKQQAYVEFSVLLDALTYQSSKSGFKAVFCHKTPKKKFIKKKISWASWPVYKNF